MERRYVAIVRTARRSHYGVEFPDFPGVVTAGRTMEEAAGLPSRAVRVNITVDEHLLRAADAEAARRGTSRSGSISELIRDAVR